MSPTINDHFVTGSWNMNNRDIRLYPAILRRVRVRKVSYGWIRTGGSGVDFRFRSEI